MDPIWSVMVVCGTVILVTATIAGAYRTVALKRCELWQRDLDIEARKVSLAEREADAAGREYLE